MRHGAQADPIAADGRSCVGPNFSSDMLAEAQRKAEARGLAVEWIPGDMRAFDLGRTVDFVFIMANFLLHLVERFGDWTRRPFAADSPLQLGVCDLHRAAAG
ncbi:class I SAM-dependent methyltransferase [Actinoplanes sp. NPDC026619]|uniref:class I SAM-dependent methyltransferase n=1 Tax=Actinoplanes sp. NPDC026619 TaxID=3155798 RepID=UPI0033D7A956